MHGWWAVSYVVLWIVVVALALLVLALVREIGTLHLRLGPRGALEIDGEGPPLGETPQAIEASDLDGRPVVVGGPGREQLLLFVSPGCPVCRDVLPSFGVAASAAGLDPIVIAEADETGAWELARDAHIGAPVVASPDAAHAYGVPGTPYAVALDRYGVVRAKGTVNTLEQIEGLVDTARRREHETAPVMH